MNISSIFPVSFSVHPLQESFPFSKFFTRPFHRETQLPPILDSTHTLCSILNELVSELFFLWGFPRSLKSKYLIFLRILFCLFWKFFFVLSLSIDIRILRTS